MPRPLRKPTPQSPSARDSRQPAAPLRDVAPSPVAIVVSRYNRSITDALLEGAISEYQKRGGAESDLDVFDAPGTYELPVLARAAVLTGRYAGAVALGCVIRGQTRHDRYICDAVAHGLMDVSVRTGTPVAFGVLTVENPGQARDRAGGKMGNKGAEAMGALLDTLDALASIGGRAPAGAAAPGRPDKARGSKAGGRA